MTAKKSTVIFVVIFAAVLLLGGAFLLINKKGNNNLIKSLGNKQHKCLGPDGFSWCEPRQKCIKSWEEKCYKDENEGIKHAYSKKYNKEFALLKVFVSTSTGKFAIGTIQNINSGITMSDSFMAAKKDNENWDIVWDSTKRLDCSILKQNNFPRVLIKDICK